MATLEQMREAIERLNTAADAYYNGRGELMTDFEWDALFDKLRAWEAETGVILPDSPTQKVSADDLAGEKEAHEFAALSLAKTKNPAEVSKWAGGRAIWVSWKLDGLTLVATYDNGKLTKLVTRGDGHVGTNVTHLVKGIVNVPTEISFKGHLVARGEAVISYADFEAFRASSQEDYANPRNLAAGSFTLKDVAEFARRRVTWVPFTLESPAHIATWGGRMDFLKGLGFTPVQHEKLEVSDESTIRAAIERWTTHVTNRENPFPVDGLVFTFDDMAYAQTGSITGHHATRAGFAFKWQDTAATTTLDHIEWSAAIHSISPVAVFAPVSLEGTEVRRASLCNISECERLGIGGKGSVLSVIKANKIIPKVVAVTQKVGEFEIPVKCPVCGAPTQIASSETLTRTLKCTNANCPARMLRKFMRFVSKEGLDIDGLAGETLAKFINRGWIKTPADIYRLKAHHDEIAALEGFGKKSADNICAAVEAARKRSAVNLLVALAIPSCGGDVAKRLLGAYPLRELIAKGAAAAHPTDLFSGGANIFEHIEGIGPGKSASFVAWCGDNENVALVNDLLAEIEVEEFQAAQGGTCAGLTFVITGDVHLYANRAALKAYIEAQGGKVAGSVSNNTSFLINNDVTSSSSKNVKARALGIPIISEEKFNENYT